MLNTAFLLAARYDGRVVLPLEEVRRDFFPHLTLNAFSRKLASGNIALPVLRIEASQKSPKVVHLSDLAVYIDRCRDEAARVVAAMAR